MDTGDQTIVAALIVGVPLALKFGTDFVKWMANRTVEREDKDKAEMKGRLEELDESHEELDRKLERLALEQGSQKSSLDGKLGEINGRLTQLDTRIEKSSAAAEERFEKVILAMTTDLNRKLSQMTAEIPDMVRRTLDEQRERTRYGRKR